MGSFCKRDSREKRRINAKEAVARLLRFAEEINEAIDDCKYLSGMERYRLLGFVENNLNVYSIDLMDVLELVLANENILPEEAEFCKYCRTFESWVPGLSKNGHRVIDYLVARDSNNFDYANYDFRLEECFHALAENSHVLEFIAGRLELYLVAQNLMDSEILQQWDYQPTK
jgi:hypothetical protein